MTLLAVMQVKSLESRENTNGSITVFCSLVLCLILSLISTIIEGARVGTLTSISKEALIQAMDTRLTEYNKELWTDYHILAFQQREKEKEEQQLKEWIEETIHPVLSSGSYLSLLNAAVSELDILEEIPLDGYNGEIFAYEAIEYMKYQTLETIIEQIMDKFGIAAELSDTVELVGKKLELEEKAGILNQEILKLMEQIEGLDLGKMGIQYEPGSKKIKSKRNFVKQFAVKGISKEALSISNDSIWQALYIKYKNPIPIITQIEAQARNVRNNIQQIEQLNRSLSSLYSTSTEGWKEAQIQSLNQSIRSIQSQIQSLEREITSYLSNIKENKKELVSFSKKIKPTVEYAIEVIPQLKEKQQQVQQQLTEYESVFEEKSGKVQKELLEGLQEDLESIKKYMEKEGSTDGEISTITRIINMKPYLEENKRILETAISFQDVTITRSIESMDNVSSIVSNLKQQFSNYHVTELYFDYSNVIIDSQAENPMKGLGDLLRDGILSLVVEDIDKVSNNAITKRDLSNSTVKREEVQLEEEIGQGLEQSIAGCQEEGYQTEFTKTVQDYTVKFDISELLQTGLEEIIKKICMNEYVMSHFKDYTNQYSNAIELDTKLEYEKEYFIAGKEGDKQNLLITVTAIIAIRTILNYISLTADKESSAKAYTTAAALVGFTLLEPLVRVTKNIILFAWAYEEALVDTASLLLEKEVPFFKSAKEFSISYEEMLLVNSDLIRQKAKAFPKEGKTVCFSYQDYTRIFLLIRGRKKMSYMAMDLIEENLKLRYSSDFLIEQHKYGISAKLKIEIEPKLLTLPFVHRTIGKQTSGWEKEFIWEQSY